MTILEAKNKLSLFFPDYEWNSTPSIDMGVFSTNQAFKQAKLVSGKPIDVANDLAKQINFKLAELGLPLVAIQSGPYINIKLKDEYWANHLGNLNTINLPQDTQKIVLEYICPNVAKPLHPGHILQGNFAESIRRIAKLKHKNIITNNYWGDWGVQFGIVIWAWKQIGAKSVKVTINEVEQELSLSDYENDPINTLVKVYVWGNAQENFVENWHSLVRQEHLKLEQGNEENKILFNKFLRDSQDAVKTILVKMNIKPFDVEQGESSVMKDELPELIEFLDKHGLWQVDGIGRYIDSDWLRDRISPQMQISDKDLKTFGRCYLIQSKDGYTTYALRDIAAKIRFARLLKFDKYITFVGNEQTHHFHQVYTIIKFLHYQPEFASFYGSEVNDRLDGDKLGNIFNGMLAMSDFKMSTRKGNFLSVEDIISKIEQESQIVLKNKQSQLTQEEVNERGRIIALAALKWFNLNRDISQNATLDIPTILNFEGNTGVYQLYTVARLASILRKNTEFDFSDISMQQLWLKYNQEEQNLVMQTYLLPQILDKICTSYKPHLLTTYLFDLSNSINSWYSKYSVIAETDTDRKKALVFLCDQLKKHLEFCLDLLAIPTIDEL